MLQRPRPGQRNKLQDWPAAAELLTISPIEQLLNAIEPPNRKHLKGNAMKTTTHQPNSKRAAFLDIVRQFREAHGDMPLGQPGHRWAEARGLLLLARSDELRPA